MSLGQIVNPLEMRSDDILESIQMTKGSKLYFISRARRFKSRQDLKISWISEENPCPIAVGPVVAG